MVRICSRFFKEILLYEAPMVIFLLLIYTLVPMEKV